MDIVGEERGDMDLPRTITNEQALAILQEHGLDVNQEQAASILAFLRQLASITVIQILIK